jgi:hypothetical protein
MRNLRTGVAIAALMIAMPAMAADWGNLQTYYWLSEGHPRPYESVYWKETLSRNSDTGRFALPGSLFIRKRAHILV